MFGKVVQIGMFFAALTAGLCFVVDKAPGKLKEILKNARISTEKIHKPIEEIMEVLNWSRISEKKIKIIEKKATGGQIYLKSEDDVEDGGESRKTRMSIKRYRTKKLFFLRISGVNTRKKYYIIVPQNFYFGTYINNVFRKSSLQKFKLVDKPYEDTPPDGYQKLGSR